MAEQRVSKKRASETTGESTGGEISRRELLKAAGAAAAGAAVVGGLARAASAQASPPQPPANDVPGPQPHPPASHVATEGRSLWERFTERARRVIFFAQEEAARLGENFVGTEHLLLGLIRENDHVAAKILDRLGVPLGRIHSDILRQAARGQGNMGEDMLLTPAGKQVIDLANEEARQLNNNYLGTEHLLLGLIREGDGLAARVLGKLGAELERTRREVYAMQMKAG